MENVCLSATSNCLVGAVVLVALAIRALAVTPPAPAPSFVPEVGCIILEETPAADHDLSRGHEPASGAR
jgi:hypothetical protein